jgi:flagellar hook-associated protein 1 FlgK
MPVTASNGIEIGRRALQAQQTALQVTSHNIANANTPGYARRTVDLTNVAGVPGTGVGSGVDVTGVVRQNNAFLDAQARVEQQVLGRWEAVERAMTGIEAIFNEPAGAGSSEAGTIFNEPSGLGLSGSLSRFWNAWQDLANVPESGAARAAVRQEADFLVTTMHQIHSQVADTRRGLDEDIVSQVQEINGILDSLAAINGEIPRAGAGTLSGDLIDERERLLQDLSNRVNISVLEKDNGQVSVLLAGHNLVQQNQAVHLDVRSVTQNDFPTSVVFFSDDGSVTSIEEGQLKGLMEVRDNTIPDVLGRMDALAGALVSEVNRLHRSGTGPTGATAVDFFDSDKTSASNIAVDTKVLEDLNNIAASGDGNTGDNSVAIAIAGLRNATDIAGLQGDTVEGFFFTLLGEVGARSKEAQTMAENHRLFASQIDNRRQGVQGVSLNDEASQLVLFQRAYQAAARTVSTIDQLMETTINL